MTGGIQPPDGVTDTTQPSLSAAWMDVVPVQNAPFPAGTRVEDVLRVYFDGEGQPGRGMIQVGRDQSGNIRLKVGRGDTHDVKESDRSGGSIQGHY